jgi:hypothetical protein
MRDPIAFALADKDFYTPLETAADPGRRFRPSRVPEGWRRVESGGWTQWELGGLDGVREGWKVHVSARPDRLDEVLDAASAVLFDEGVTFKHLSAQLFFRWQYHKHASRAQGGKFIAAYPLDVEQAGRLMERLREALADEQGPYILTDRRYRDSTTVHYRYGAYVPLTRMGADGIPRYLVHDGDGKLVEDKRGAAFEPPEGVVDPFVAAPAEDRSASTAPQSTAAAAEISLGDYVVEDVIRHSNGGGAYRGRHAATGRPVFIKEARAHTGLVGISGPTDTAQQRLKAEFETLKALRRSAPGLAPKPLAYLRAWEHEFLVTEFIEGSDLQKWVAVNTPLIGVDADAREIAEYYRRCEAIITAIEATLDRLHACGYYFVDVSPGNVLIGPNDEVHFIDFESAQPIGARFTGLGTPGFTPPLSLIGEDRGIFDEYGLAALAQSLIGPFHHVAQRNPDALAHLRHELAERAPVPAAIWARATRFHAPGPNPVLPTPEQVAEDPLRHLAELRDATAAGLLELADIDNPISVFPTIAEGHVANTQCVAYGTAGVVHVLRRAGMTLPDGLVERLRRDALDSAEKLAPGLYSGLSGIAWVLADCGLLDDALHLLKAADDHPLVDENATLFGGSAGVAMTHLALYGHTGEQRHVDRALQLAAKLPADDLLTEQIGPHDATGLLHGRCGIALMLQQVAAVTGDDGLLERGVRLLHAELDRATDPDAPSLIFPVSDVDRREMPYLYCGSAGLAATTARYLNAVADERLAADLPRLLAPLRTTLTALPSLFAGLSGLGLSLTEHARAAGDDTSAQAALRVARGLFKFAIPHGGAVRFLGDQQMRFSAELYSGSAGVLLFLDQVLDPRPDPLFTVDALARRTAKLA